MHVNIFRKDILMLFSLKSAACISPPNQSAQTFSSSRLFWGNTDGKSHGCLHAQELKGGNLKHGEENNGAHNFQLPSH